MQWYVLKDENKTTRLVKVQNENRDTFENKYKNQILFASETITQAMEFIIKRPVIQKRTIRR